MIENTQKQLRAARERLRTSREALAGDAAEAAAREVEGSYWPPRSLAATAPADENQYVPVIETGWVRRVFRWMPFWW
jgi:hypothetical protein